jgi:quercetin dioxygenase-like cupin family protein
MKRKTPVAQYFIELEGRRCKKIGSGVTAKVINGKYLMLSFVEFLEGGDMQIHSHPEEQTGIVLEGEIEFIIDKEIRNLKAGDSYLIPPHILHGAKSKGKARVLDIFSPPRKDYL